MRRAKARSFSGCESRPATLVPAGSNRSSREGNDAAEASGVEGHSSDLASMQAVTRSERRAGLERRDAEADPPNLRGRLLPVGEESEMCT